MYDRFTPEQKNAVKAKGSVIVTAAAGSGKTAVLTERVIDKLKNESLSADRLLIVTFTNLAAAEMKNRIEKRLYEECENAPFNLHLLKQRLLISSADICTIDSFCIKLLRNHFGKIGINPDFKIADPTTEDMLSKKVLSKIFKEHYETSDEDFYEFLKSTDSIYSDENAQNRVLELYKKVMTMPFYRERLDKMLSDYSNDNVFESVWFEFLFSSLSEKAEELKNALSTQFGTLEGDEKSYFAVGTVINTYVSYLGNIEKAAKEKDFDRIKAFVINPPEKPNLKQKFDSEIKARVKANFEIVNDLLSSYLPIFSLSKEEIENEMHLCQKLANVLVSLCKEFDEKYFAELSKKGLLTFQISEQLAFNLLCENAKDGFASSEVSKEISNFYDEVMVDEYQDVNNLQNMLFYILSDYGKKLFVVGDAKQSIYGFRNASPEFFISKAKNAVPYDQELAGEVLKRVVLSANFRSRKGICDFVNGFFSLAMSEKFGGMVYDELEKLNPKADFLGTAEECVEFRFTESADQSPLEIAKYICECVSRKMLVQSKDSNGLPVLRPVTFGDFAVLFRTSTKFSSYYEAFNEYNIPVSISDGNFFEAAEIKCITAFLTAINSPMNDIAMLTVLMSPVFGFTAEEIAIIKSADKKSRLYKLLKAKSGNDNPKIQRFLEIFNLYRQKAACLKTADLISFILEHSDLLNYYSSCPFGDRRVSNLLYFEEIAEAFSGENLGDLSEFLYHIKFLAEKGEIKQSTISQENSVKFLTMHKSKGLQFPVVIVAEAASNFSLKSTQDDLAVDEKLGLSFTRLDEENAIKYISTPKKITNMHILKKEREEELRLLYVVMTRAEEKLVFFLPHSGTKSSPLFVAKEKLACFSDSTGISPMAFSESKSTAVWILMYALLLKGFEGIRDDLGVSPNVIPDTVRLSDAKATYSFDSVLEPEILGETGEEEKASELPVDFNFKEAFEYKYPFQKLREIEAKTSVSALVKENKTTEYFGASRPAFMSNKELSPAEKGTALHKFLQYADFRLLKTDALKELDRLRELEFLSSLEANAIDLSQITAFTKTNIFERMVSSNKVLKEQRFLISVPAGELQKDLEAKLCNEEIIVQGAIDCIFFEENKPILIDFKTDRVSDEKELLNRYFEQLKIYSVAIEKMFGHKVKECYIYSLHLNKWILVSV